MLKKTYTDSDTASDVLSCESSQFIKYLVFHELYAKKYVQMTKIHLPKKFHNFGFKKDSSIKILYKNFKASNYVI